MPVEEEVTRCDRTGGFGNANVVQVNTAALEVLPSLAVAGAAPVRTNQFRQLQPGAVQPPCLEFLRPHLAGDLVERRLRDSIQPAPETDLAGADGLLRGVLSVEQVGHRTSQGLVSGPGTG